MLWPPHESLSFQDMNRTLVAPAGYKFYGAVADGAFLRVEFRQPVFKPETLIVIARNIVVIWLNDMGREVARTYGQVFIQTPVKMSNLQPVARRFRIKNGFLLMLHGLQEMTRCLRSY
jgi:hypothetical protein